MNVNKVEEREHKVFAQTFTRRAIGSILAGMVSLGLCIASAKNNLDMLAVVFCIAFLGSGAYVLIYLNYRLRHVRCPECGDLCVTSKDLHIKQWVATCDRCNIKWKLGVGIKSASNI